MHPLPVPLIQTLLLAALQLGARLGWACEPVEYGGGPAADENLRSVASRCSAASYEPLGQLEWPREPALYLRRRSTGSGERWRADTLKAAAAAAAAAGAAVEPHFEVLVDAGQPRQEILGYGGAFTDSACLVLRKLAGEMRERAMRDYFAPEGLHYNLGRVPIGGTDMSWRLYSYDDRLHNNDTRHDGEQLSHFRLQPEDLDYKIPAILEAQRLRGGGGGGGGDGDGGHPLRLFAASWSAPAWMKSNRNLVQGGLLGNSSSSPYYDAYAHYIVRFIHEYERRNVSVWALSPQNEPCTPKRLGPSVVNFNSVNFEPEEMADFLERSMLPALIRSGKIPGKLRLFLWDDTQDNINNYVRAAMRRALVREHVAGVAYHWYSQGLKNKGYAAIRQVRRQLPANYSVVSTEASFIGRPQPGNWTRGERYAADMIENLRLGSVAWIDWNLALNMSGGPSWSRNHLDAALLVDWQAGVYYRNPMYYALAHVAKFLPAGARVLHAHTRPLAAGTAPAERGAPLAVAAELPGDPAQPRRLGLVLQNRAGEPASLRLRLDNCPLQADQASLELALPGHSLTSLAFAC